MMKNKIITLILVAFATITNAQNTFTAKVLDSENAEALIGASLILKGTTNGVSTDVNGLAILKNIPNGEHIIEFKFSPPSYFVGEKISLVFSILVILLFFGALAVEFKPNRS